MNQIQWNTEWELNNELIDGQHKELIDIINRLIANKTNAITLLQEFIDYTSKHFIDEETMMIDSHFPKELFKFHKEEHKAFVNLLLEVSFEITKGTNKELNTKFKQFCVEWFKHHFLGTDKYFVNFLEKEVKK